MGSRKFKKTINKIEELPSFLLNLKSIPEDTDILQRPKKSVSYLGPIFFGECPHSHPPRREVRLGSYQHVQLFKPSKDNILKDVFLPKVDEERKHFESKAFIPVIRHPKVFADPFSHKCPGVRKVFAPDIFVSEGLGETKSIIEGEMSREIPFCRLKKFSDECDPQNTQSEFEVVTLSDIREEKRIFMSYNERMAHAHYPKEFVTVRVIGPTIPEALTITKLPSKRQSSFEIDLHLKSKAVKSSKKLDKDKENANEGAVADTEKERQDLKESIHSLLSKKESNIEEEADSDNIRQQGEDSEEESGPVKSQIIRDKEEEEGEEEGGGEREGEGEGEALEEGGGEEEEPGEREGDKEKAFADEEKEGSLGEMEEENLPEAAED